MIRMHRLFGSFAICLLASMITLGEVRAQESPAPEKPAAGSATVELSIRFADGRSRNFEKVPFRQGMTIADLMTSVQSEKANDFRFEHKGAGATAFLLSIDGVANQSGQRKDFWIYRVNGKLGDRSFGAYSLKPGDKVLWHLGKYEPE